MEEKKSAAPPRLGNWLWKALRKKTAKEQDRIERDLVVGKFERREFAGDPSQAEFVQIPLRQPRK
jgi:hypothetical protein